MSDDEKTAVLDFLRVRFARVDGVLEKIVERQDEHLARFGRVERLVADLHVQGAEHSVRMDRISARLDRIERRFDLVEVAP